MTSEEKAREILDRANFNTDEYLSELEDLREMAEWKDQQFKEYLEKKKLDMEQNILYCNESDARKFDERIIAITEIINELFKEEQK